MLAFSTYLHQDNSAAQEKVSKRKKEIPLKLQNKLVRFRLATAAGRFYYASEEF